jgi:hypothetical protein
VIAAFWIWKLNLVDLWPFKAIVTSRATMCGRLTSAIPLDSRHKCNNCYGVVAAAANAAAATHFLIGKQDIHS